MQGEHFQNWSWTEGVGKVCIFDGKLAISQKRREMVPRLLLITNRKWHKPFQMRRKSWTLDDLKGQYYNRNCIGCSMSYLATAGLFCSYSVEGRRLLYFPEFVGVTLFFCSQDFEKVVNKCWLNVLMVPTSVWLLELRSWSKSLKFDGKYFRNGWRYSKSDKYIFYSDSSGVRRKKFGELWFTEFKDLEV